jgi:hypothetical protein
MHMADCRDEEIAALIVHRVNTYDALVEALENLCAIDDIAAWATQWEAARKGAIMTKPANPYAFSGERYEANGRITYQEGMTLRDWFAGQLIAGITARQYSEPTRHAALAYQYADAMLAERAVQP